MSGRLRITIFVVVVGSLVFLMWRFRVRHVPKPEPTQEAIQSSNTPARRTDNAIQTATNAAQVAVPPPESGNAFVLDDRQKSPEIFEQYVQSRNSPINFYGKVIDQYSNALAGVDVMVRVRQWYVASVAALNMEGKMIHVQKTSGPDGAFEIHGVSGDGFDIEHIQKEGYELSGGTYPSYGPSSGGVANPVIFKMWKKGAKEPLVSGQKVFGLIPDGRVYTVDLLKGKKSEGAEGEGDLRVAIVRPTGAKPNDRYELSFRIEGIGGGVLQTDDEFMYLAPESGYEPKLEVQLVASDSAWTPLVKKRLFFRSRGGSLYGRLDLEINAVYNDKSAIEINYAVNPSGSRNLQ